MTEPIDAFFRSAVLDLAPPTGVLPSGQPGQMDPERLWNCFRAQAQSRHLDLAARRLRSEGKGFYTIGSSGHEGNAALAQALQPSDPALLHYRSGAFYLVRSTQVPGIDGVRDILLGVVAAADDPASGGRHKVFGRSDLAVIPQTSTIASHLPRALGVARAIETARSLGVPTRWPSDAVVVCSFGDASVNHSTATGAINAADSLAFQGLPVPLLLVCEDNGLGISVRTPPGWVEAALSRYGSIRYEAVDGCDVTKIAPAADELVAWVRRTRSPAVLHMRTVRFMGHAGSDAEIAYRTPREIESDYARDPLLATARALVGQGVATPQQVAARYDELGRHVDETADSVASSPGIGSRRQLTAPIEASSPDEVREMAAGASPDEHRADVFRAKLPEDAPGLTLAESINATLTDVMAAHHDVVLFGEDVGVKGGVYGVTRGLQRRFGPERVFDTLLDEQTILGTALGAAVSGLTPVAEIQYLAYLHNAADQIRGEAATLSFFSSGTFANGMVVRIAGLAYQKGFGGHFHNDNAIAALRDIPGLVVVVPASAAEAPELLRACISLAHVDGKVCVFLEPIAAYHTRDLYADGDELMLHRYPPPSSWPSQLALPGTAHVHGDGGDLTLVTFGNGVRMSLRVARRLAEQGIHARVLDLRWVAPLPVDDIWTHATATGRVLVVDETRRSGGVSEGVLAALVDRGYDGAVRRVASQDSFVPLGDATRFVLLSEEEIEQAAREVVAAS